jgi:pyruvate/2-oxoacid:ferredoxin oxidoreductase beta subunit
MTHDDKDLISCCGCGVRRSVSHTGRVSVWFCEACCRRYPPALLKACYDPFDYALQLSTGHVIRFHEARIHGDYVTLFGDGGPEDQGVAGLAHGCPRGVDVRVDAIVWCADAPDGS